MSYDSKGTRGTVDPFEAGCLQTADHAGRRPGAALAVGIPNVMKDFSIVFQHAERLLIERQRIEVACQGEHGRIMDDRRERLRVEPPDLLEGIADDPCNVGIFEQSLRPGILTGHLLRHGIDLDRDNTSGRLGGFDRRVPQAGRRVQHIPFKRRDGFDFVQRVLIRIRTFDAMHWDAGNQHGGSGLGGHQAIDPPGKFGEASNRFDYLIFHGIASRFIFADLFEAFPIQAFAIRE